MTLTFSRRPKKSLFRRLIEWIITIIAAIIIALFIISNIVTLTQIKEQSMEPTLSEDDRVIVNKLRYILNEPEVGDIVILNSNIEEKGIIRNMVYEGKDIVENIKYRFTGEIEKNNLVKRVIGVEGDIINIMDGNLYINNTLQEESYINGLTQAKSSTKYPLEVTEEKVFVMGDNRENSLDSRNFGLIGTESIKGRVGYRILPFGKFGIIH